MKNKFKIVFLVWLFLLQGCSFKEKEEGVVLDINEEMRKDAYLHVKGINFDYNKLDLTENQNSDRTLFYIFFEYLYKDEENLSAYKRELTSFTEYYESNCAILDNCSLKVPFTVIMSSCTDVFKKTQGEESILNDDDIEYLYTLCKQYEDLKSYIESDEIATNNMYTMLLMLSYINGDIEEAQKYSDLSDEIWQ